MVDGTNVINMTENIHSRATWQALTPSGITGFYYEKQYIGFLGTPSGSIKGFILNPSEPDNAYTELTLTLSAIGFSDIRTDALYYLDGSNDIQEFNAGSSAAATAIWRSKKFDMGFETMMSCAQMEYDIDGAVATFGYYGDGSLIHNASILSNSVQPFRLPSETTNFRFFEFYLTADDTIRSVKVASSMTELAAIGNG